MKNILRLSLVSEKKPNQFCPRCGLVVPQETKCIASPTRPEVHYHPDCFYALAQGVGCLIQWA
jgi:hypothetical protein